MVCDGGTRGRHVHREFAASAEGEPDSFLSALRDRRGSRHAEPSRIRVQSNRLESVVPSQSKVQCFLAIRVRVAGLTCACEAALQVNDACRFATADSEDRPMSALAGDAEFVLAASSSAILTTST